MKKITLLLLLLFSIFANAQFFEGFENGVPGTMTQTFTKGETTFIDFSIAAVGAMWNSPFTNPITGVTDNHIAGTVRLSNATMETYTQATSSST